MVARQTQASTVQQELMLITTIV